MQLGSINPTSLQPYINPNEARTFAVQMAASLSVARGARIAQLTANGKGTPPVLTKISAGIAPVAADGASGSIPAGDYYFGYTYVNANGETVLSATYKLTAAGSKKIDVSAVTPLPTGAASVNWYMSPVAGDTAVVFLRNNVGTAFTIDLADLPAAGAAPPPQANTAYLKTDGSQTPLYIAKFDFQTDSSGNIFLGNSTVPVTGFASLPEQTVECYYKGDFLKSDLPGITAAEIALLGGRVIGVGAAEIVHIP